MKYTESTQQNMIKNNSTLKWVKRQVDPEIDLWKFSSHIILAVAY